MHPRDFLAEFVDPAIETYRINRTAKHLAVHAIAQLDIMAEIVAFTVLSNGRPMLDRKEASQFRLNLGTREPDLKIVHDAHDSHKHGLWGRGLRQPDPQGASQGQRPEPGVGHAFFLGVTYLSGPLTPYGVLELTLNDGSKVEVWSLIARSRRAWDNELARQHL